MFEALQHVNDRVTNPTAWGEDDVRRQAPVFDLNSSHATCSFIIHSYMPVTSRNLVSPGVAVSIVLKPDQRTGRQVQGVVADVLTRRDHPRGIKVRLRDGQVGRVHGLTPSPSQSQSHSQPPYSKRTPQAGRFVKMSQPHDNNPWGDQTSPSRTNPFEQIPSAAQNNPWGEQQPQQPESQRHDQSQSANYYEPPPNPPQSHQYQSHQQYQQQQPQQPQAFQHPNRSQTDQMLPQGQERSEQVETMQNYESRAPQSREDKDRAQLEKEFPSVDGSLVAALYGDSKNLAETRELLEELSKGQ